MFLAPPLPCRAAAWRTRVAAGRLRLAVVFLVQLSAIKRNRAQLSQIGTGEFWLRTAIGQERKTPGTGKVAAAPRRCFFRGKRRDASSTLRRSPIRPLPSSLSPPRPLSRRKLSKSRRASAAWNSYYHVFMGLQNIFFRKGGDPGKDPKRRALFPAGGFRFFGAAGPSRPARRLETARRSRHRVRIQ